VIRRFRGRRRRWCWSVVIVVSSGEKRGREGRRVMTCVNVQMEGEILYASDQRIAATAGGSVGCTIGRRMEGKVAVTLLAIVTLSE
jgi:hypothetical protein